ncbi:myb-like dna-binding domain containing protein [Stylonychia lemnae]|uniref:Myb-like dna-binding domain containing protein n=1 Tax=Stylonychia lemnae TaxID=5949 RepID=A0A078BBT3_STYLE|nr:myb-like dna-binding domain containing protein [Stylonychia lemnae]|eukprot:CDW91048.1 myb-like dna-binding domain containing protein [Stylonychia lemnae]
MPPSNIQLSPRSYNRPMFEQKSQLPINNQLSARQQYHQPQYTQYSHQLPPNRDMQQQSRSQQYHQQSVIAQPTNMYQYQQEIINQNPPYYKSHQTQLPFTPEQNINHTPYFKNLNYAPNVPFYPGRPPIFVQPQVSPEETYYSQTSNQFQNQQNLELDAYLIGEGDGIIGSQGYETQIVNNQMNNMRKFSQTPSQDKEVVAFRFQDKDYNIFGENLINDFEANQIYSKLLQEAKTTASSQDNNLNSNKNKKNTSSWRDDETHLLQWIEQEGPKEWTKIADTLNHFTGSVRNGKQCRERWNNTLNPAIRKGKWSLQEDLVLLQKQREMGNKWSEISHYLNGRTENQIKNRFNCLVRKGQSQKSTDSSSSLKQLIDSLINKYETQLQNKTMQTKGHFSKSHNHDEMMLLSSVDGGDDENNSDSEEDYLEDMDGDYLEDLCEQNLNQNQLFSDFNLGPNSNNSKENEQNDSEIRLSPISNEESKIQSKMNDFQQLHEQSFKTSSEGKKRSATKLAANKTKNLLMSLVRQDSQQKLIKRTNSAKDSSSDKQSSGNQASTFQDLQQAVDDDYDFSQNTNEFDEFSQIDQMNSNLPNTQMEIDVEGQFIKMNDFLQYPKVSSPKLGNPCQQQNTTSLNSQYQNI